MGFLQEAYDLDLNLSKSDFAQLSLRESKKKNPELLFCSIKTQLFLYLILGLTKGEDCYESEVNCFSMK